LQLSEKNVALRFINPSRITFPPAPTTVLGIDVEGQLTPDDLERICVFFNNIIRAYRFVTKETYNNGVISQIAKDQFLKLILYGEIDAHGNFVDRPRSIHFVRSLEIGTIDEETYSEIRRLAETPDLFLSRSYDEILLQAKSFFEQENYRMAILEAVIALEIVVSSIIKKLAGEKQIPEDKTEQFLVDVGLAEALDVVLKLLCSDALPAPEIIAGCKGANSIRNNIIHRACLSVSQREAQDAINNIEAFIQHIQPLIN
jgi:hypothetical protein